MSTELKHILFLPRWYPHQMDGMFGLFVKKHAEAVALYNQVSVLYVQGLNTNQDFPKKESFESPQLFTSIYYYKNSKCKIWNSLRYCYYLIIGYNTIRKERGEIDLTHVHILTRLGIFAFLLKLISKKPYIITEHWSRYLPSSATYKGRVRKLLSKYVVKHAEAILPVSTLLSDAMQKHGLTNKNYEIVPNVVEDVFFQSFDNDKKTNKTVFLHVSTFEDRSKNISGILRVIKQLSSINSEFEFWFVGDGIDFEAMKKYSNTLAIPKEVIQFQGLLEGKLLAEKYQQADYLVIFSNYETFLVVFNEAQACGLPVISTRVGELQQQINETNGIIIEPQREDQLFEILKGVLNNPPNFSKELIRKSAKNKYSYKEVGLQIDSIYNKSL